MTKYFTSITITEKVGIPALTEIIRKNIALLIVLLSTYSTFAQSVSQPSTSNITYQSASATVLFNPNCANGGNITFEWSINSDLSNSQSGTYSVGNGSFSRSMTLNSLLPSTRYYWRAIGRSGLNCNQAPAISPTQTFFTSIAPPASLPGVSITSITFDDAYATINYALNANYGTTTSIIKYGTTSGNLFNQLTGISITVTGNAITPGSALLSGLEQNTTYYYQIEATNSAGTTTSTTASFTTAAIVVPQLVSEYTFDNTYNDVNGNSPFSTNSGVSLVSDRHGNANSAINIVNTGSTATISGLPYGAASRTIAFWVKVNNFSSSYNMLYSYGQAGLSQVNGASYSASTVYHFGYNNNHQESQTSTANTWYHFAFTYDGTSSRIYRNGALVGTSAKTWNTVNNNNLFNLGIGVGGELLFDGAIDDLKIYGTALSQTQVNNLYSSYVVTSLGDYTENQTFNVYPNPAKNILHVSGQAEIFDLVGNKVASGTNEINIEHLISGIYVVKAMDRIIKIVKE